MKHAIESTLVFTVPAHDLMSTEICIALAIVALVCVAIYDLAPRWSWEKKSRR